MKDDRISTMKTPLSREEFEHNINLLMEKARHISKASESAQGSFMYFTYPSLSKVRNLPNGRLNLQTVDEGLRLDANTANHMSNMDAMEYDSLGDEQIIK